MATAVKVNYPNAQNYIAKFTHKEKPSFLLLCVNVNEEFQFIDLQTGRIHNISFDTVEEAEKWLYAVAEVYEKNAIATTYVP